jgi:hypothetical protein
VENPPPAPPEATKAPSTPRQEPTPARSAPKEPARPPASQPSRATPPPAVAREPEPAPPVPTPAEPAPQAQTPVAPAPASPPPVAAPQPAAPARPAGPSPEDQVRAVLRSYEAAYESLDARAVRALWPGLGDQRQHDLQKAFDAYRSLELELNDCAITVTGDTAQANCKMRQSFQPKVGEGARREAPIRFRLARQGEGWRIESTGS